jgi:phospholipid/cholesterol/gamma-HCH transport system permease protein
VEFGAASWLPSLVTVALVRSLAPLVTALIVAGKVGSSIGAEIGSMKVTEQVDALEVSAVSPARYLVATRTLATTLMTPVLTMYFGLVAFLGSFVNVVTNEGITWQAFVLSGFSTVTPLDVWSALGRSLFFGFLIGLIAAFSGMRTSRGTAGVGIAANKAVVHSMLAVFIGEVFIVQIIDLIRRFA